MSPHSCRLIGWRIFYTFPNHFWIQGSFNKDPLVHSCLSREEISGWEEKVSLELSQECSGQEGHGINITAQKRLSARLTLRPLRCDQQPSFMRTFCAPRPMQYSFFKLFSFLNMKTIQVLDTTLISAVTIGWGSGPGVVSQAAFSFYATYFISLESSSKHLYLYYLNNL